MQLTKNFTLEELCKSATARTYAIDNEPGEKEKANLKKLAETILQPIREKYGKPITINSAYRCAALNAKVKGSRTSQHLEGGAADLSCKGSKAELFKLILNMMAKGEIQVGQLIWEYGTKTEPNWIHVSIPRTGKKNGQVLYLY